MATHDINAICSQILTTEDLVVEEELFQEVINNKIVTKILDNKGSKYIKIFSKEQLFLSHITPLLHNFGFEIIDEVTYNVMDKKDTIFISRFNLSNPNLEKIELAKSNIEDIITFSLKDTTVKEQVVNARKSASLNKEKSKKKAKMARASRKKNK